MNVKFAENGMKTLLIFVLFMLSGCATYTYKGKDCQVSIMSMRSVEDGRIEIDKNCKLKAGANNLDSTAVLNEMVKRIPLPVK